MGQGKERKQIDICELFTCLKQVWIKRSGLQT